MGYVEKCRPLVEKILAYDILFIFLQRQNECLLEDSNELTKKKGTNMKKIILSFLTIIAMALAPLSVSAQSHDDVDGVTSATQQSGGQHHNHGNRLTVDSLNTYMTEKLSLTSSQASKVKALNEQYRDIIEGPQRRRGEGRPQRTGSEASQDKSFSRNVCDTARRHNPFAMMAERQQAYESELHKILSDSQYSGYESIKPLFASQRRPRQRKEQ